MTHDEIEAATGPALDELFARAVGWVRHPDCMGGLPPYPAFHQDGGLVLKLMRAAGWEDAHSWNPENGAYWAFGREWQRVGFGRANVRGDWTDPDDGVAVVKAALSAIRKYEDAREGKVPG